MEEELTEENKMLYFNETETYEWNFFTNIKKNSQILSSGLKKIFSKKQTMISLLPFELRAFKIRPKEPFNLFVI